MSKYKRLIKDIVGSVDYWSQAAMRHFVMEIDNRMKEMDVSRAKLAEKMGTTPAYVSKVMRGDVNFTLETMTKLAMAVGGKLQIRVIDQSSPIVISRPLELGEQARTSWSLAREAPMKAKATRTLTVVATRSGVKTPRYDYETVSGRAA